MTLLINEWPEEVIPHMTGKIFQTAMMIRDITGCMMIPSPNPKAHVRFEDGKSRHCVGVDGSGRSDATDIFIANSQAWKFWELAQKCPDLSGFGIYFDSDLNGRKQVMVHLDMRQTPLMWLCPNQDKREYIYYDNDPALFLRDIGRTI